MNFNKVILIGRIANDIDCKTLDESKGVVARFVVAINRRIRNSVSGINEVTSFIPVVAWRQNADFVSKYLSKGSLVSVEGYINVSRYTAKTTGNIMERFEVVAEGIESLETRSTNETRRIQTQKDMPQRNAYKNQQYFNSYSQESFGLENKNTNINSENIDHNNVQKNIDLKDENEKNNQDFMDPQEFIKRVSQKEEKQKIIEEVKRNVINIPNTSINKKDPNPYLVSEELINKDYRENIFDNEMVKIWGVDETE